MAKPSRRARSKGHPSIVAVEVDGWPGVGGKVRLELEPRWTVLFGRNAAGKSALLEGVYAGLCLARPSAPQGPERFRVEARLPNSKLLLYEHSHKPSSRRSRFRSEPASSWSETCRYEGGKKPVWTLQKQRVRTRLSSDIVPKESDAVTVTGSFAGQERSLIETGRMFTEHVPAGVPREDLVRRDLVFGRSEGDPWSLLHPEVQERRLGMFLEDLVALRIGRMHDQARFEEFVELGRRIELFRKVELVQFRSKKRATSEELATLEVDGINVGLLSDGTLRVMETLLSLLFTRPGALLLIEEPETGIHPGLLSSLLNVIESYSADKQVVFSTHSPLVVSRASPNELRLVERKNGKTSVRSLSSKEAKLAARYLESEGTLGEFVYSGALDDEA